MKASASGWWRALVVGTLVLAAHGSAAAREEAGRNTRSGPAFAQVTLSALPVEAQQTHSLIRRAGPFPYPHRDGAVFANRERKLPREPRGYYREYTVPTPGSPDRGARRIVCGGERLSRPEVCYYTQDHYASFRRIVE